MEKLVRLAGLEPARVTPLPPQSSVSANSTISATGGVMKQHQPAVASRFSPAGCGCVRGGFSYRENVGAANLGRMGEKFRIESDSMGEMRVAAHALYGAQTARAVENFPISG